MLPSLNAPSRIDAAPGVQVQLSEVGSAVAVSVTGAQVDFVTLYWPLSLPPETQLLGDTWERGYGDLAWGLAGDRGRLPWYAAWTVDGHTVAVGTETGAKALASWEITPGYLLLCLDLRSGNRPLRLEGQTLEAARLRHYLSLPRENAFHAVQAFCRLLCPKPKIVGHPIYGTNDWYYAYGNNRREDLVRDAHRTAGWATGLANLPYCVIDAGWQPLGGCDGGFWDHGNEAFGDMASLATDIREAGCRPGIWIRPLFSEESHPEHWYLKPKTLDPSVPEVLVHVSEMMARCRHWGFDLIKHDFSTWDVTGRWGFEMVEAFFGAGPTFSNDRQTTAEIISGLYDAIRSAAGEAVLIGCNTVGHLAAGTHEVQRTGDDTSGREWSRTRKMGVNTAAFRAPQHGAFFQADADCVGLTKEIPWELNRQWLELLADGGTPLFVSAAPDAVGPAQEAALRQGFAHASLPQPIGEPLDWQTTLTPTRWLLRGREVEFDWEG